MKDLSLHAIPEDPAAVAKAARLRYVSDRTRGIRREKDGDNFRYISPDGEPLTDEKTLERIRQLAIPPAYTDVWISPLPNGHLQATGRDAKGRKQYRYHKRWRAARDETKYDRMLAFGSALPRIRERVTHDLALPDLPREKVLATIVRLLETTRIRIGNEEYARQNDSYGLTTLRNDHADVRGSAVLFHFRGKSGKEHEIGVRDSRVARVIRKCQDLPGQELFEYLDPDDGTLRHITSEDVNDYLHEIAGEEFTAKDFRTWAGTLLCALCLAETGAAESETKRKHNVTDAVKHVAERLGNTPTVCRKCYIHPALLDAYLDGSLPEVLALPGGITAEPGSAMDLSQEEKSVLKFLSGQSSG
jgi:DNA topoisomerase-1